jgi:hypothetical protein
MWRLAAALAAGCAGGKDGDDGTVDASAAHTGAGHTGAAPHTASVPHTGDPPHTGAGACATPADAVGDPTWPVEVHVTSDGPWCGAVNEARTLAEELAVKARLTIVRGTYRLPADAGTSPFRLPVCVETRDGLRGPGDVGTIDVTGYASGGYASLGWASSQPLVDEAGDAAGSFALGGWASGTEGFVPGPYTLDGVNDTTIRMEPLTLSTCGPGPDGCVGPLGVGFGPCAPVGFDEQHDQVAFDGGEVDFRLDVGQSYASTEPSAFVRATGTLDGVAFDVDNYFRLVYSPTHHHFTRSYAVLFDAPIGGACGLAVRDLWTLPDVARVERVDCDLTALDARAIQGQVHVP